MSNPLHPGAVIFTGDRDRLVKFYQAVTEWSVRSSDDTITVLGGGSYELVIHVLPDEPVNDGPAPARIDGYIKPFFPVASLARARAAAQAAGGRLSPPDEEWEARGFRACEATDPDGNVIQFRESKS